MSIRDQRVGTGHPDTALRDVSSMSACRTARLAAVSTIYIDPARHRWGATALDL